MRQLDAKRIGALVVLLALAAGAAVLAWRWTAGKGESPAGPAPSLQPTDAMPLDPAVRRTGDGRYTIARATWDEWMKSPPQLVAGARVVAVVKDGLQQGFALQDLEPGSVAARLGLQSGDIITHLNDTPLSGMVAVMRTLGALGIAAEVVIRFQRGGQESTYTYGIVPAPAPPAGPPP